MISTSCPGCSAKFQVPEQLVAGKVVRFRCRKCGGPIAVDGTSCAKGTMAGTAPAVADRPSQSAPTEIGTVSTSDIVRLVPEQPSQPVASTGPSESPASTTEARAALRPKGSRVATLVWSDGATNGIGSIPPPADVEHQSTDAQVQPQVGSPVVFDLARTPPPGDVDVSLLSGATPEAAGVPEATSPDEVDDAAATLKIQAVRLAPLASAEAGVRRASEGKERLEERPAASSGESPATTAAEVPAAFDGEVLPTKPTPTREKTELSAKKKAQDSAARPPAVDSASGVAQSAEELSPQPPTSKATKGKSRVSAQLGGVFAVPEVPKDTDTDIEVELDDKALALEPLPITPTPMRVKPPAPRLKRVVLDFGEETKARGPESMSLPSAPFFSPVMIPQPDVSQPVPVSQPPAASADSMYESKVRGSGKGKWLAIMLGGGGALFLALFLAIRGTSEGPAQPSSSSRMGTPSAMPTPSVAPTIAAAPEVESTASAPAQAAPPAAPTNFPIVVSPVGNAGQPTTTGQDGPSVKKPMAAGAGGSEAVATGEPPKPTEPSGGKTASKQPQPTEADEVPFDKAAASSAIAARKASAAGCKQEDGPTGHAKVSITFAPSGRVTTASVNGPPFAGTSVGGCIASKFRAVTVPPFSGNPVTVHTTVGVF